MSTKKTLGQILLESKIKIVDDYFLSLQSKILDRVCAREQLTETYYVDADIVGFMSPDMSEYWFTKWLVSEDLHMNVTEMQNGKLKLTFEPLVSV